MLWLRGEGGSSHRTSQPRPFPDEPRAALDWALPRIKDALKESKMLPIMLIPLKHQEALRSLALYRIIHVYE